MNKLEQLKQYTHVVADTGDIEAIVHFKPLDATTNPSLLLKTIKLAHYAPLVTDARHWAKKHTGNVSEQRTVCAEKLAVSIGCAILNVIPGRISTEVDARLSFDTQATIASAHRLMDYYHQAGTDNSRILIKIAATWEGIRAAEQLEKEGIQCNMTLVFDFTQAEACADAGVFMISPFVGRILDWYQKHTGKSYPAKHDPGVQSVTRIYHHYKQHDYNTIVMGASFRNIGEIEQLAGCDRLTIAPTLLQALSEDQGTLKRRLHPSNTGSRINKTVTTEPSFRYRLNNNAMATEKLAEGIRLFTRDQIALEQQLV